MNNTKMLLVWLIVGTIITGCELPGKPDFKTSQKVEAPIMYNKTFQFLGDSNALIDTTSEDLDSLFTIDDQDFILITKEEEFDFGDLNDAIPQVNVDPTSFDAQVGEIALENFSSGSNSNLGSANFQELTNIDPSLISAGDPIPGGATPSAVNIAIGANTDYFVSAVIKSGGLRVSVTNNLGFNIDKIDVVLKSGSNEVGSVPLMNVNHNITTFGTIDFSNGTLLEDLNVEVSVQWSAQNMQESPGDLVVENVTGVDLIASQVEAVVESQDFVTNSLTEFDDSEFRFNEFTHFVELESGDLNISSIQNSIDIAVENMVISFPGIRKPPYAEADSLIIEYSGASAIPRKGSSPENNIDLSGYRIYAQDNQIEYNIVAQTENTQSGAGSDPRILNEFDMVSSSVAISNLSVKEAFGVIVPQNVILGDDDISNGTEILDLYNDVEAQITEIDGLGEMSNKIEGIKFTDPTIGIRYTTSVGVGTTVYGAFLGVDASGNQVFLHGTSDSEYEVVSTDPIDGLSANGIQLVPNQLIKFELETSTDENLVSGVIEFNIGNTNVDDFLNNLPSEIRFIGKAVINEDNVEGGITTPVQFDPVIEVGLPMAFRTTENAFFSDTMDVEIDAPSASDGDQMLITNAKLIMDYINGLPLGLNINLKFLDDFKQELFSIPVEGEEILLNSSAIDETTRFASTPTSSSTAIVLNKDQMDDLNKARQIVISADISSNNNEEVKLRSTDSIVLTVKAELTFEAEIN